MSAVSPRFEVVVGSAAGLEGERGAPLRRSSRERAGSAWNAVWRSRLTLVAGPLLVLVVWQLAVSLGHVSANKIPAPWDVLTTLRSLSSAGTLWSALAISVRRVALGLLLGIVIGVAFALVSGLSRIGERFIDPVMHMFRTMPVLALLPLFVLWWGIGEQAKVYVIAWATIFPIYINTYAGVRGADTKLIEAGRVLGLSRLGQIRHVILPSALPQFLTGLRLALGLGWIVLVAAEEINATTGLGYLITNAENLLQTDVIFAVLLVYSLLGVFSDLLVRAIERWALAWRSSYVIK
jgi:sulfonate transport system permease protein